VVVVVVVVCGGDDDQPTERYVRESMKWLRHNHIKIGTETCMQHRMMGPHSHRRACRMLGSPASKNHRLPLYHTTFRSAKWPSSIRTWLPSCTSNTKHSMKHTDKYQRATPAAVRS
jgi:hypothetical protein